MTASTRIRPARHVSPGDTPVFVDRTGRRRRFVMAAGATAALLLTVIILALLAGLTGAGPGVMPGWPAADRHARPVRQAPDPTGLSPSTKAAAPVRSSASPPRPAATAPPTSTGPAATASPTTVSAAPTTSATTRGNGRGRNPSHTPNPHSTKKP